MTVLHRSALALVFACLAACDGDTVTGTTCSTDASCNLFNVQGTCETTGFCSYPDPSCTDGRRYSPGAGDDLANTCLGGELPCGVRDQACCGMTCGANLACAIEGADAGTCRCGSSDEPCCDGTTCDTGLTCSAGTCEALLGVTDVALGKNTVCARRTTGSIDCWGYDTSWHYDYPGRATPTINTLTPTPITPLTGVIELRATDLRMCARKMDGTIWCWGHNEIGEFGDGTTTSTSTTAVQVAGITDVTMFDVGRMHACAIGKYMGTDGLWCWGRNAQKAGKGAMKNPNLGRLGNGTVTESPTPVAVDLSAATGAGQTVKSLSTGALHSCIVMSDDKVWCWGRNKDGALGNGALVDTSSPVQVNLGGLNPAIPGGVTIDEVICTEHRKNDTTCIRLSNGSVYCWGSGAKGELGDGTTGNRSAPTARVYLGAFGTAKAVALAAGNNTLCARSDAGQVACWGKNQKGLLGHGLPNSLDYSTPVLAMVSGATRLVMGHSTACTVDAQNRLVCWGNNQQGQLTRHAPTPTETGVIVPLQVLP